MIFSQLLKSMCWPIRWKLRNKPKFQLLKVNWKSIINWKKINQSLRHLWSNHFKLESKSILPHKYNFACCAFLLFLKISAARIEIRTLYPKVNLPWPVSVKPNRSADWVKKWICLLFSTLYRLFVVGSTESLDGLTLSQASQTERQGAKSVCMVFHKRWEISGILRRLFRGFDSDRTVDDASKRRSEPSANARPIGINRSLTREKPFSIVYARARTTLSIDRTFWLGISARARVRARFALLFYIWIMCCITGSSSKENSTLH